MAKIPDFETLDQVVEFWETHDTADYWEEMEEVTFEVDLHKNLLHPGLIVLSHRPEHCPGSDQTFEKIVIEYVASADGRLVVIRDVPVLLCRQSGKKYILEETLDKVEHLLALEKEARVQPNEVLEVPVFSLKASV
jgi:YgiT-type zinc finger domain-containing protein